jgi:serine O-acetyltransferase
MNEEKATGLWRQITEDIDCVFDRDPAARSRLEILLTYPGVHALLWQRIANRLWRWQLKFAARFIAYISRLLTNIDIHPGATIGRRLFIDHGAGVVIGETAIIGNDVTLYHGVTLGGTTWNKGRRHPCLSDGVMVGAGAKVLGAITLGKNVRVGANSVVVSDVPGERSVVGIPARVVAREKQSVDGLNGVDLNHHLIPDPVGRAISCLLDRIDHLEAKLQQRSEQCVTCGEDCDLNEFDRHGNPLHKVEGL